MYCVISYDTVHEYMLLSGFCYLDQVIDAGYGRNETVAVYPQEVPLSSPQRKVIFMQGIDDS